jgi:hypothetical protein
MLMPSSRPQPAGKPHDRLFTPDEAMQGPLDYHSQRLLVATAPAGAGEPKVSVGLTEAAALIGVHKRITSTWVIVGFVLPVLGSLGLTSFALRRFSKVEEYLRRLARIDVLTGLPNRRSFHGLLRGAVARSKRTNEKLALLFVDIGLKRCSRSSRLSPSTCAARSPSAFPFINHAPHRVELAEQLSKVGREIHASLPEAHKRHAVDTSYRFGSAEAGGC